MNDRYRVSDLAAFIHKNIELFRCETRIKLYYSIHKNHSGEESKSGINCE